MKTKTIRNIARCMLFIFVAAMILMFIPQPASAETPDIIFTSVDASDTSISKGDEFNVLLTFKNISDYELHNVVLDFSSATNVSPVDGVTSLTPDDPSSGTLTTSGADQEGTLSIDLELTVSTGDGKIPVTFMYTVDDDNDPDTEEVDYSTTTYFAVNAKAASSSTATPSDTSKYKPVVTATIIGSSSVSGGQTDDVVVELKNTSENYAAKSLSVESALTETETITGVTFSSDVPVKELAPGKTARFTMHVSASRFADEGAFVLPLTLTYMNPWSDSFTSTARVTLNILNSNTAGLLSVKSTSLSTPTVSAGKTFGLTIVVENSGTMAARDVRIGLDGLAADGITLASGSARSAFDSIEGGGTRTLTFQLAASKDLKSGSVPLTVKFDYSDLKGTKTSDTDQVWIPVAGVGTTNALVSMQDMKISASTIDPGQQVSVTVDVVNQGTAASGQLKISADGGTVLFPVSQNLFVVNDLAAGAKKTLTFKFQAQADAARGSAPITLKLEPEDEKETISQAVAVFVNGTTDSDDKDDATKNVPKVIVSSYSYEPEVVKAGEKFTLNLAFTNTHGSKTIKNIRASFTVVETSTQTTGNVFTPVDSSNTFFIDGISPKSEVTKSVNLYVIPDATAKTYTVTISFDYEDEKGNSFKTDEIIGIPVYQPSRFDISESNVPTDMMMGEQGYAAFDLYNLGKTTLYNVKMTFEGDFEASPKSQYFGNFEPGANEYLELTLTPTMAGTANGKVTISYESATGEATEAVKEFSVNVNEMMVDPGMDGGMVDENGNPIGGDVSYDENGNPIDPNAPADGPFYTKLWFKIAAVAAIVLIVLFVVIRIVRKRKLEKGSDF